MKLEEFEHEPGVYPCDCGCAVQEKYKGGCNYRNCQAWLAWFTKEWRGIQKAANA